MDIDTTLLYTLTERVGMGLATVRAAIEDVVVDGCSLDPTKITIIGVTKGWGPEAVLAGLANGLSWFGENYADELVEKASAVSRALEAAVISPPTGRPKWTFQGRIQSNKIPRLKNIVDFWQSVDSVEHARALGLRVPGAEVLIQVLLDASNARSGCLSDAVPAVVAAAQASGLRVSGLMGVAPDVALHGQAAARDAFIRLQRLAADQQLGVLSMGMSNDYRLAVAHGATHLRLGSILFGERQAV
jgi:PLP dependent protein